MGGEIPYGFVARRYSVIIYNDSNRSRILNRYHGEIDIDDPYLIDKQGWFVSKIIEVTPNQSVVLNQTINIYIKILQPCKCNLLITVQKGNQVPETIYEQLVTDAVKEKQISFPYTFTSWAIHKFRFNLSTSISLWIDDWCPPMAEYVEERESIIHVGEN
ncbi:MAG: hypothetical protein FJ213_10785 [Ignavibacteria bacterium]|nr:hypothetical protein [Ignavibacteria bacterium]